MRLREKVDRDVKRKIRKERKQYTALGINSTSVKYFFIPTRVQIRAEMTQKLLGAALLRTNFRDF